MPAKERHQIFVHSHKVDGLKSLSVKPLNLHVAKPHCEEDTDALVSLSGRQPHVFSKNCTVALMPSPTENFKRSSPMECFMGNGLGAKIVTTTVDTCHGPDSIKTCAVLQTVCDRLPAGVRPSLFLALLPKIEEKTSNSFVTISSV